MRRQVSNRRQDLCQDLADDHMYNGGGTTVKSVPAMTALRVTRIRKHNETHTNKRCCNRFGGNKGAKKQRCNLQFFPGDNTVRLLSTKNFITVDTTLEKQTCNVPSRPTGTTYHPYSYVVSFFFHQSHVRIHGNNSLDSALLIQSLPLLLQVVCQSNS
jgi:hypothetical protein